MIVFLSAGALASYDPDLALQIEYFAGAAYCDEGDLRSWSCGDPCAKQPDFSLHDVFSVKVMGQPTQVFYGTDKTTGNVIISFEGTHDT